MKQFDMKRRVTILFFGCLFLLVSGCKKKNDTFKPAAEFTGSPIGGIAPLTVSFSDQSSNNPTTWNWDFGDGTTSNEQNPSKTYTEAGIYTVEMTAKNSGGQDTQVKTDYIVVVEGDSFTDDRDGTVYKYVTIGEQVWMAENLKYLPEVVGPGTNSITDPHYYIYYYDGTDVAAVKATEYYSTYGVLYNWPAAIEACPAGWHLPDDEEWTALTNFLNEEVNAAGKLKEADTAHWQAPNTGATNETGFTALPGGYYDNQGNFFYNIGKTGYWWTTDEYTTHFGRHRFMTYNESYVNRSFTNKGHGFSVRCVRD